jgi:hypothetical protein
VIFEFGETTYVDTIWFVGWDDTDWMAALYKDTPTAPWRLTYRFRYHATEDPWDGADRKSTYELTSADGSDEKGTATRDGVDKVVAQMMEARGGHLSRGVIRGTARQAGDWLITQPWCHVKVLPAEPERAQ